MKKEKTVVSPQGLPVAVVLLMAISAASCLLALFQWMELLSVAAGGSAVCGISETVNCAAVWSSPLATRLHSLTKVPVAGLGLIWGATAFALSAMLVHQLVGGRNPRAAIVALRITAAVGVLACITFAVASFRMGAVCLTCLGTYALALAFALVAWKLLPGPVEPGPGELKPALAWSAGFAVVAYLLALGPGLATKKLQGDGTFPSASDQTAGGTGGSSTQLEQFLMGLPTETQRAVSESLAHYRDAPQVTPPAFETRQLWGPNDAPVKLVEWTDIRCGHCASLSRTLSELKSAVPEGRFSVEPRHFPLAKECNPLAPRPDPTGVACTGAKAQICLEGRPEYWDVQEALFEEQQTLTRERILELASSRGLAREALEQCIGSSETAEKLAQDVTYASAFRPRGTPLVLVNGREGTPVGPFLYAMILTGGDASAKAFEKLPPATHSHGP